MFQKRRRPGEVKKSGENFKGPLLVLNLQSIKATSLDKGSVNSAEPEARQPEQAVEQISSEITYLERTEHKRQGRWSVLKVGPH